MKSRSLIVRDDEILGGLPVFAGTRVPVKTLFDYLKSNHPLDDFLDDFPTVGRAHAQALLDFSAQQIQDARDEVAA
jgi:uncharacterized protein (DUF433 family)